MTSRKPTRKVYIPKAVDGDNDGMVQDGTEFERPAGTEFTADKIIELMTEMAKVKPLTHLMQEGENILTVADLYKPEGMTRNQYAKALEGKNTRFTAGALIQLV